MAPAAGETQRGGSLESRGVKVAVNYVCTTAFQPGQQTETLSQKPTNQTTITTKKKKKKKRNRIDDLEIDPCFVR